MKRLAVLLFAALTATSSMALLDTAKIETRYCGAPARDVAGGIIRSQAVISAFRKEHKCPDAKGNETTCPGWEIDHVIPLACGGCDSVSNMQWLPTETKIGPSKVAKDRWERKVYAHKQIYDGPHCQGQSVTK